jgi:hypothetical protein|tara:strand:- start:77 stop:361 length:285 start_codon:yes stop_codon:yes gene_type:complete
MRLGRDCSAYKEHDDQNSASEDKRNHLSVKEIALPELAEIDYIFGPCSRQFHDISLLGNEDSQVVVAVELIDIVVTNPSKPARIVATDSSKTHR